ncbi:hypothetical protein E6P09_18175 (plasmid) [Haloferax mediterranei ATCC 33500]|uniref:Uncharacterized protein n=1 Tax=Haloferax mediterranei (strain ATCC 33500 / DSM 1411 / JCM 8866 / NBRC 14739 / NCIMB 2177 / R-4) TaxID=523841 RepID=I3RA35_HALMT|nr:hypothetical protein [Haloferax mediterranei]AFK21095.1 hypothetical protein HFX_5263 [Haloferax mediterranei ATCC 33500]AHZ24317.1 hypothetical protein BM92_19150 [Haloferax mediterranei ATCC 33500]EMA05403.1 hypothetical protein C439_01350 [Haloferax mediterranei ATCC 33500]MDX5989799.1 hypothetical protein [Haloferax mediterranei ATCC 33500]QCQ77243.1 hypothetical protein E6P09_18175 [Haloferax mediterranei ATCC 33500]
MSSPLSNPFVHYGIGLSSTAILVFIAFTFVDGITRWLMLGIAVLELTVAPQILKRVGQAA